MGEKPETFTGLALAPNEGRTVKGWRMDVLDEQFIAALSGEHFKELTQLLGNETAAWHILFQFLGMAKVGYGDASSDAFAQKDQRTDAETLQRLQSAISHINALVPLLDDRLAWITAWYLPGFDDGPEVAQGNEQHIQAMQSSLVALRNLLEISSACFPPIKPGRRLRLTPRLLLTISTISSLRDAGVTWSTGEGSRMVRALRLCWAAAGIDEDPRDLLRSLKTREGAQILG